MKILLITHQLDFSGAPLALLSLSKVLIKLNHSLVIASLKYGPLINNFLKLGINPFEPTKHLDDDFDIIIANTTPSVPHAVQFTKNPKKIIAWIHESQFYFDKWNASPKSFLIDKVGSIIVLTNFQFNLFKDYVNKDNIFRVHNYIEPINKANLNNKTTKNFTHEDYWVCCGNWGKPKGQEKLLNIISELNLSLKIVFLGAQQPTNINNESYIFTGPVDYEASRNIINNSLGLISNSISEVQPLSILEALSSGKPILISNIDAHNELKMIFNKIEIFDPNNNDSFLNGINNCKLLIKNIDYINSQIAIVNQYFGFDSFSEKIGLIIKNVIDMDIN